MKVLLLAFDPTRLAAIVRHTRSHLQAADELMVVSTAEVAGESTYVPGTLRVDYSSDQSLALTARVRRTLRLYRANLESWRALRRDVGFVALVRWADLVVIGDEVSVRTAWQVSRHSSTPVWGRISTIPYARATVVTAD